MIAFAQLAWIAVFAGLLALGVRALRRARKDPRAIVGRGRVLAYAAVVGALGVGAAWAWGGAYAHDGRDRIAAGAQAGAPARARLFVRAVQLAVPLDREGAAAGVGYSPASDLRLPRRYELDEAKRGWDLLDVSAQGPQGLRVATHVNPELTGTVVVLAAQRRAADALLPVTGDLVALGRSAVGRRQCRDQVARRRVARLGFKRVAVRDPARVTAAALDGPGVILAVICREADIVAALAFERDLGAVATPTGAAAPAPSVAVRVTPLRLGARGLEAEHTEIAAGTLLQIGALGDAVPGITLWEVPAPAGRAELFFPPPDVLAPCSDWLARRGPILPSAPETGGAPRERMESGELGASCVLPFSPPFAFEVRRLVPDVAGVDARSTWAALLLTAPALVFLLVLGARVRGEITRARVARGLVLAWVGCLFAALAVWRLLWAHRLDMMREYESIGERVAGNQLMLLFAAGALAAGAVLAAHDPAQRGRPRVLLLAVLAWAGTLVAGGHGLRGSIELVRETRGAGTLIAQAALSLALGLAAGLQRLPASGARAADALRAGLVRFDGPIRIAVAGVAAAAAVVAVIALVRDGRDAMSFRLALGGVAYAAIFLLRPTRIGLAALLFTALGFAGAVLARDAVVLKLPLACVALALFYLAVRGLIAGGDAPRSSRLADAAAAMLVVIATVTYDIGVGVALLGPGAPLAVLVAAHDACFSELDRGKINTFDTRHAPLVRWHGGVLLAVAMIVIVWSSQVHADLGPAMTRGALLAPVLFAILVGVHAVRVARGNPDAGAQRRFVLVVCLSLAGLALLFTALQGPILAAFTDSESRHASRVSGVLDPGYALLRDDRDFLAGLAAWRETILPRDGGTWPSGQGYFGAQVVDRGVWQSIENDYLPVLFVRETGALGLIAVALLLLVAAVGLWTLAAERFAHGSVAHRGRALAAAVLGALVIYQPLASLGVLPLTGISWPGLGLDSPTDFWLLFSLVAWVGLLGSDALAGDGSRDPDAGMRSGLGFIRARRFALAVAAMLALAGVMLVARAALFALERPDPVDRDGDVAHGFEGLGHAADYALRLQCKAPEVRGKDAAAMIPDELLGEPSDDTSRRFHRQLQEHWRDERGAAIAELRRFLAEPQGRSCAGSAGAWRFERGRVAADDADGAEGPPVCTARWSFGWPEVTVAVTGGDEPVATCKTGLPGDALGALRRQEQRPYKGQRVRLVARPMGVMAGDRGELVAGHVTVRLRPGAGEVDVSRAQAGVFAAEKVRLADDLTVEIARDGGALEARGTVWTFEKLPPRQLVQVLEAEPSGWKLTAPPDATTPVPLPLESIAVLVIGGRETRNLWLYRPPRKWGGDEAAVDMLLADDVRTRGAARRRHYVLGGDLPELGWSTGDSSMSLGLDGWVQVALDQIEQRESAPREAPQLCGTLKPPEPLDPLTLSKGLDVGLNPQVCARSTYDGVVECRVSLQPELTIALRHLTELISAKPADWLKLDGAAAVGVVPATEAQFMLLRGDTGEIVAQGEFVPGRASSAFAPATPEIEQHLARVLDHRDPRTGRQLPTRDPDSSVKVEWGDPIAVGSTLKPLLARAAELAAPDVMGRALWSASPQQRCASGTHALLGHCPPTDLWRSGEPTGDVDVHRFLAESSNWFMAALGIVGTALPDGELRIDGQPISLDELTGRDLGRDLGEHAVTTSYDGATVIGSRVVLDGLRRTAMWRRFEALLGRELCTAGGKACAKQIRGDVCAARALPIDRPNTRQRSLVGLGPDGFELYDERDPQAKRSDEVPVREYFQFLRGSRKHSIGSLAQLTDAFGRVVYDPSADGVFRLAASWFPVPPVGQLPEACAVGDERTVRGPGGGLCGVLYGRGTAVRAMRGLYDDPRVVLYGAKSGTIDALGDVAEDPEACAQVNRLKTIAGKPLRAEDQPYWLQCGKPVPDDSLFLIAFGVKTERGVVPFTLGLRFERVGKGAATVAARHYIAAITAYVTGAWSAPPASPASSSGPPSSASASPP